MTLLVTPLAESPELDSVNEALSKNAPPNLKSLVIGAALVLYGVSRRSLSGFLLSALGGTLIHRAMVDTSGVAD